MKNLRAIPSLLATLLVVSNSLAQTAGSPVADDLSDPGAIAVARSKYLEKAADATATKDSETEAQLRRGGPGMPIPSRRGYNRGGYPSPWIANSDPGHALIGAGIGFAIGATIGAVGAVHNRTSVGNGVFIGGSLFALFGAAIGVSHGTGHPFMHRRRTYPVWPQDDEEGDLRVPALQKNSPATSGSRKPALPREPSEAEASTTAAPDMPPVPELRSGAAVSSPETQQ